MPHKLINDIAKLEESREDSDLLEEKKKQLEEIRQYKLQGAIVRAKCKWATEGEKPTKYFLNLENGNYTSKIISKIEKNDKTITNQEEVLEEVRLFYKNLYTENDIIEDCNLENILNSCNVNKLSNEESSKLGGPSYYI